MNSINISLGIAFILCGLLFIGVSIPLYKGSIKMNYWYGFRIGKALDSEQNWYDINKYGARRLIIWSFPIIISGIIYFFLSPQVARASNVIPLIIFTFIPVIETLMYARRL
jgi:hypothetical protein